MIDIDKATFNREVPAFRTPDLPEGDTDTVWEALAVHIDTAKMQVKDILGETELEPDSPASRLALSLICRKAARMAVAGADLVLTSAGFGIVSNQNIAPASQYRVEALKEQLRQEADNYEDRLLHALTGNNKWNRSPQAVTIIDRLFWCPSICRRNGITWQGREIYRDEFLNMGAALSTVEIQTADIISPELYSTLICIEREGRFKTEDAVYTILMVETRRFAAALLHPQHRHAAHALLRNLKGFLSRNEDTLKEYTNSRTAAADHFKRYENRKDDTTFFFG